MMKLFLVVRYGNEDEGPDGKDTIFVVSARTHVEAASRVDSSLKFAAAAYADPVVRRRAFAMLIHEIGRTLTTDEPKIVAGELLGVGACRDSIASWVRDQESDDWQRIEDVFPDVAWSRAAARARQRRRRPTKRRAQEKGSAKQGSQRRRR